MLYSKAVIIKEDKKYRKTKWNFLNRHSKLSDLWHYLYNSELHKMTSILYQKNTIYLLGSAHSHIPFTISHVLVARWQLGAAVASPSIVHFADSFCVKPRSVEQVTKNDVGYFKETQGIYPQDNAQISVSWRGHRPSRDVVNECSENGVMGWTVPGGNDCCFWMLFWCVYQICMIVESRGLPLLIV